MCPTNYCYDDNGYYTGSGPACESPLEPGVYLLPARSTRLEPPQVDAGSVAQFDGQSWSVVPIPPDPQATSTSTLSQ